MSKKQIVSWAGTLLMIASLIFLARRLYQFRDDIDMAFFVSPAVVIGLIVVALFEGLGILLASFNFRALVKNVSGVLVNRPFAMVVYTISNLYKYIPGGVMYVVGRNRLAVETEELNHPQVALSTIIEGIITVIAAILIVVITVWDHTVEYLRQVEFSTLFIVIVASVLLLAVTVIFCLRRLIVKGLRKLSEHMQVLKLSVLIKRFGFGLLIMTLWGGTFLATLMVLGQPMYPGLGATIIGLFLLSWLAGFLTPGAPSGLGVREVVILMFMGGRIYEGILLSAMLMHRIVAAVGDIAAYGVAVGYRKCVDISTKAL